METNNKQNITITKNFPVSAEQLYRSWTTPDSLKKWWHPNGNQLIEVQNDVVTGGSLRYVFGADGQNIAFEISGKYIEVAEHQKLVYTWNWNVPDAAIGNGDYKLSVSFEDTAEGSQLQVIQEGFRTEEAIQPHQQGWKTALNNLYNHLKNNTQNESNSNENTSRRTGYNEMPEQEKVGGG